MTEAYLTLLFGIIYEQMSDVILGVYLLLCYKDESLNFRNVISVSETWSLGLTI